MARRRGGGQGGASDPAFTGPRSPHSGPPWATPRNRDPLSASAIFSYSPGLPPRPHWLRLSLPAADKRSGLGGVGEREEGVDQGRGGRTEEEREGGESAAAGCGACGVCAEGEVGGRETTRGREAQE